MTKELFFEEHAEECFARVESDLEEVLEKIREYNDLDEDEFYTQIVEEGDTCDYGTYTVLQLINYALDLNPGDYVNSSFIEDFISFSFINKAFCKVTGDDIEDVYDDEERDDDKFEDDLFEAFCILMNETEIEDDEAEVMELLKEIIEDYYGFAYFCPAGNDGKLTKFHVLVSEEILTEQKQSKELR